MGRNSHLFGLFFCVGPKRIRRLHLTFSTYLLLPNGERIMQQDCALSGAKVSRIHVRSGCRYGLLRKHGCGTRFRRGAPMVQRVKVLIHATEHHFLVSLDMGRDDTVKYTQHFEDL